MAGMKFLNLKGWHPSNARNQKRIWIAEQKAEQKAQAERDAAAEVRKHAETHSFQVLAAAKGDAESARRSEQMQVGFLYAPPPGLEKVDEKVAHEMTEDDAVREFRRKMEKRSATAASGDDVRRPLERYVGRRPDEMLTIKEQVERFPFLKDAPVEGDYASNVKVNFKPMGRTLRNVKCMRCGEWGHQSGDRECALRDANPLDAARQAREDPMAMMAKLKKEGQLVLKQRALPLEMQQGTATGKGQEYEILLSDDDASVDPEKAFLAGLSTKEKKSLLKKLRKQSKEEEDAAKGRDDSEDESGSGRGDRSKKRQRKEKHVKQDEKRRHGDRQDRGDRKDSRAHRAREMHSRHDRSRSRSRSRTHDRESRRRRRDGERRRSRSRSRSNSPRRRH